MIERNLPVHLKLQERLGKYLDPKITDVRIEDYFTDGWVVYSNGDKALQELGIQLEGERTTVAVRSANIPIGRVSVHATQPGSFIIFDNEKWSGTVNASIRLVGQNCICIFNLVGNEVINLLNVLLRANEQILFWGRRSTAVECSIIEINGPGEAVVVGDDALISNGVTIRNHDMHALLDTNHFGVLNPPVTTIIEQHVWIGQDVLLLNCRRVGYGSILGARSLVKGVIPRKVAASGAPAKVIRENRSWGRDSISISKDEIDLLMRLDAIQE